ncbi:hexokinase-1 [Apiospora aurea]|uniref:Phosphotransferase n=1 Tax=Apiospora aurea TaxID=335848 RepID=A0ABR1PYF0_9PEZI
MRSFTSAIIILRKAMLAALKTLVRGRSFLQALFAFWISPAVLKEHQVNGATLQPRPRTIEDFLKEAEDLLMGPLDDNRLSDFSSQLKLQFRERMQSHAESMLPSYNHLLPSGKETGQYLALDVGGSTLRVALVELRSREMPGRECSIVRIDTFQITPELKLLKGMTFFDWMAARINEVLSDGDTQGRGPENPIPMGLAWSFPVEQTSLGSGLLLGMGKGFLATDGLLGQDLGAILEKACKNTGLNVQLGAIVNDGSATLLSQAYVHSSTRFGLILGTGTNIAVHLPVSAFGRAKFGKRPETWFDSASHVIVNTELGMFGKDILPMTRWDKLLSAAHPRPEFQPLEHFVAGFYLGEICRFALIEAIEETGLLGGVVPPSLEKPYSLDTATLSRIEADQSSTFDTALPYFAATHPSTVKPTVSDLAAIRALASFISRRSAALLAASVFSLWEVRHETEAEYITTRQNTARAAPLVAEAAAEHALERTKVAFNGSVIEHYPAYQTNCQRYIDQLVGGQSKHKGAIELVPALESSILGAAVALACTDGEQGVQ